MIDQVIDGMRIGHHWSLDMSPAAEFTFNCQMQYNINLTPPPPPPPYPHPSIYYATITHTLVNDVLAPLHHFLHHLLSPIQHVLLNNPTNILDLILLTFFPIFDLCH